MKHAQRTEKYIRLMVSGCYLTPTLQLFTKRQQSFSQIVRVNVPMTVCMIVDQIKN